MNIEILNHFKSGEQLAKQAAKDLAEEIVPLLSTRPVHVVLTGGTIGIKTLIELAPLLAHEDLTSLHVWFGDERFVAEDSEDRNYVQASHALLSKVQIPKENIHQMPATSFGSLEQAAAGFASHLESAAPEFDILLLGMGPDGHVASLFPDATPEPFGNLVVAESHSPKPPEKRISLSFSALEGARQVWFLVSGAEKAEAVSRVFTERKLPAAQVSGKELTRWYLDTAAAGKLTS